MWSVARRAVLGALSCFSLCIRAEVKDASLLEMASAHVCRLARRDGVVPWTHDDTVTNYFGHVRSVGDGSLSPGTYTLRIRDVDGWLEIRDDEGGMVRQLAPANDHPTDWLRVLFNLDEDQIQKNYWRLSYLVSVWDVVDESFVEAPEPVSHRARLRADSDSAVTNADFSAISVTDHVVSYVARWPLSLRPLGEILDIYACSDLARQDWRRVDSVSTAGLSCHTGRVASASVPGWDAGLRLVHDPDCFAVTNVVAAPFGLEGPFTNVFWSCDHHAVSPKPLFLRYSDRTDADHDGIPDCLRKWGGDRDSDSDGLPDWWEVWHGLDAFSVNSDGDSLSDAAEIGTVEILSGEDFLWFDIADRPNLIRTSAERDGVFLHSALTSPFVWRGQEYPVADWYLDGFLHLLPSDSWNVWEESFCNPQEGLVFGRDLLADGCVTVAGCNDDMFAKPTEWSSGMFKWSVVTNNVVYDVFAWRNVGLSERSSGTSPRMTHEVIFSSAEPGVVYVSYLEVDEGVSARNMALGVQASGVASPLCTNEHYTLRWPTHLVRPAPLTTVRYTLGTATDPRSPDTDGDGIPDGFVPVCDFDADGDGLADSIDPEPSVSGGVCHGQSDAWVRASFTNAEEILSVGYTNWVAALVGVNEPNGRCSLTVSVTNAPVRPVLVRVGGFAVVVDCCGDLVFPLEVFRSYELEVRNSEATPDFACYDGFPAALGTARLEVSWTIDGHLGSVSVTPVLVTDPATVRRDSAVGTTLHAIWNVQSADYSWQDDLDEVVLSDPHASETTIEALRYETLMSVVATDPTGHHVATGTVTVVGSDAQPPVSSREPASLGWTTGTYEENAVLQPDTMRTKWVSLAGNAARRVPCSYTQNIVIPAGRTVYAGVFIASTEYPDWTSAGSPYNDLLNWRITGDTITPFRGDARVNACHELFAASAHAVRGADNAAFVGGRFLSAPTNAAMTVTVTLGANNIGDGERESGVAIGFFPVIVLQANCPQVTGVFGTTDAGLTRTNALIRNSGVAYITGEPAPPALTARVRGLPNWIPIAWSGEITSEREAYRPDDIDTRILSTNLLRGAEVYDVTAAFTNEVIGGKLVLSAQVSNSVVSTLPIYIRGKNPKDNVASNYIGSAVAADFRGFAWMIAKHESKSGNRVYNQFNPQSGLKEMPFKGNDTLSASGSVVTNYGWGMCQIDKGATGLVTRAVYDWKGNVAEMNAKLVSSLATYNRFLGYFRDRYQNDSTTRWYEPDLVTTNLDGRAVSLKEWSILTFYNGVGGCPGIRLNGHVRYSPFEFDPVGTNWIFHLNSTRYPINVFGNRLSGEVE